MRVRDVIGWFLTGLAIVLIPMRWVLFLATAAMLIATVRITQSVPRAARARERRGGAVAGGSQR